MTAPLEQWTIVFDRPLRIDILESARKHGAQTDYSSLSFKDAYPLLKHICEEWYGDFNPFEFSFLEYKDPLAYSVALTITRPDDIAIEFPASRSYPNKNDAKLHAALIAIKEGAIRFILDCPASIPPAEPSICLPDTPSSHRANEFVARRGLGEPKALVQSVSEEPVGTDDCSSPSIKHINHATQCVFRERKLKPPKSALKWKIIKHEDGSFSAQLTVTLPSGCSKSFGDVGKCGQTYATDKEAKTVTAAQAIDAGVLLFIAAEQLRNGHVITAPSSDLAAPFRNKGLPKANPSITLSRRPVLPNKSSSNDPHAQLLPLASSNPASSQHVLPKLKSRSPTPEPSILFDPSASFERGTKRARSEDDSGEPSAIGISLPMIVLFPSRNPDTVTEASSGVGQTGGLAVPPPTKKQKTKTVVGRAVTSNPGESPVVMYGPSYSQILSEFCVQSGLAPPSFRYEEDHGKYRVTLLVDGSRYDLRKAYQTADMAKERLSQRFLALKGVIAEKQ